MSKRRRAKQANRNKRAKHKTRKQLLHNQKSSAVIWKARFPVADVFQMACMKATKRQWRLFELGGRVSNKLSLALSAAGIDITPYLTGEKSESEVLQSIEPLSGGSRWSNLRDIESACNACESAIRNLKNLYEGIDDECLETLSVITWLEQNTDIPEPLDSFVNEIEQEEGITALTFARLFLRADDVLLSNLKAFAPSIIKEKLRANLESEGITSLSHDWEDWLATATSLGINAGDHGENKFVLLYKQILHMTQRIEIDESIRQRVRERGTETQKSLGLNSRIESRSSSSSKGRKPSPVIIAMNSFIRDQLAISSTDRVKADDIRDAHAVWWDQLSANERTDAPTTTKSPGEAAKAMNRLAAKVSDN